MLTTRINPTLSTESNTTVNTAFTTIETELSFLISLPPSEAKRLSRMGLRNETFTRSVMDAAQLNPAIVPQTADAARLEQVQLTREQLLALEQRAQRLYEKLRHTNAVLGADLFEGARNIYKTLQTFGRAAGLGALLDALSERFKGQGKKKGGGTTPTTPVNPAA